MHLSYKTLVSSLVLLLTWGSSAPVLADGGWYVGGSVGQSFVEFDVPGSDESVVGFDDRSTSWKLFGGYLVDFPLVDVGVEGGYVDLGSTADRFPGFEASADLNGVNLWGVAGVDIGPVGVFGKVGAIAWELDGRTSGLVNQRFDESGANLGYGLGAKFMLFSFEVRAEYERYDIEDGVDMVSVGANWVF